MKLIDILNQAQSLTEMANIPFDVTGIRSVYMYASTKSAAHGRHGPRIKVSNVAGRYDQGDCFVVIIDRLNPETVGRVKLLPSVVRDIEDWVRQNYEVLMSYWETAPMQCADGTIVGPFLDRTPFLAALSPLK